MQVVVENTVYQVHLAPSVSQETLNGVARALQTILQDPNVTKVTFDCRHAAAQMYYQHNTKITPICDLQVSYCCAASH